MISAEAAKGDIDKLIKETKSNDIVIILKAILVAIKVILTTRTNTSKIMAKMGIPLDEKEIK